MLASDTVTKDPDQKKSNLIFHSRVHLENFAPAIFVRITPEKQLARAMLKNKAAGHEAWMNLLANPVKRCGLDVAQRSRLATRQEGYGAKVALTRRVMARRKGFEPLTPRFVVLLSLFP